MWIGPRRIWIDHTCTANMVQTMSEQSRWNCLTRKFQFNPDIDPIAGVKWFRSCKIKYVRDGACLILKQLLTTDHTHIAGASS